MRAVRKKTFFVPPIRKKRQKKSFRPPKKRAKEKHLFCRKTAKQPFADKQKTVFSRSFSESYVKHSRFLFVLFFNQIRRLCRVGTVFCVGFAVRFFGVPLLFGSVSALCADFGSFRSQESRSCRIIRLCGIPVPTRHCAVREAHGASFRFRREAHRCLL